MSDRASRRLSSEPGGGGPSGPSPPIRQNISSTSLQQLGGSGAAAAAAASSTATVQRPERRRQSSNSTSLSRSPGLPPPSIDPVAESGTGGDQQQPQTDQEVAAPPQTPFTPFFALVEDTATRVSQHPRVHYIFADDDPEILTEALADATSRHSQRSSSHGQPPERTIIVDVAPNPDGRPGYTVAGTSSLSAEWAVTDARLSPIVAAGGGDERGLMLHIEGVAVEAAGLAGGLSSVASSGSRERGPGGADEYSALSEDFDRRMTVLRRVVQAGSGAAAQNAAAVAAAAAKAIDSSTTGATIGEGTENVQPPGAESVSGSSRETS